MKLDGVGFKFENPNFCSSSNLDSFLQMSEYYANQFI